MCCEEFVDTTDKKRLLRLANLFFRMLIGGRDLDDAIMMPSMSTSLLQPVQGSFQVLTWTEENSACLKNEWLVSSIVTASYHSTCSTYFDVAVCAWTVLRKYQLHFFATGYSE